MVLGEMPVRYRHDKNTVIFTSAIWASKEQCFILDLLSLLHKKRAMCIYAGRPTFSPDNCPIMYHTGLLFALGVINTERA